MTDPRREAAFRELESFFAPHELEKPAIESDPRMALASALAWIDEHMALYQRVRASWRTHRAAHADASRITGKMMAVVPATHHFAKAGALLVDARRNVEDAGRAIDAGEAALASISVDRVVPPREDESP